MKSFIYCSLAYLVLMTTFYLFSIFPHYLLIEMGIIETSSALIHLISIILYLRLLFLYKTKKITLLGLGLSFFFLMEELSYGLVLNEQWMHKYAFSAYLFQIDSFHDFLTIIILKLKTLPTLILLGIGLILFCGPLFILSFKKEVIKKIINKEQEIFITTYFFVFLLFALALYLDSFTGVKWQKFLEELLELAASLVNLSLPISLLSNAKANIAKQ